MNSTSWTRWKLACVTAAAISLGATGYLSLAIAYPKPVVGLLGPDWQCHRIAFLTSCTRLEQVGPAAERLGKGAGAPSQRPISTCAQSASLSMSTDGRPSGRPSSVDTTFEIKRTNVADVGCRRQFLDHGPAD